MSVPTVQEEHTSNTVVSEEVASGGNAFNSPLQVFQEKYNSFVNAINDTTMGVYDNAMNASRIMATKIREFGIAMSGEESIPYTQQNIDIIKGLKKKNPKLYEQLSKFASEVSKQPVESRGQKIIEFANILIKNGLLDPPTGTSKT